MSLARELWKRIEPIHAVTYFAPESIAAAKHAGLKGFWMGYFGFRAAPMGAVGAGPVHAAFANFAKPMVERSLPDAWLHATPASLLDARASAASAALQRLAPAIVHSGAAELSVLNNSLARIVAQADPLGRPLFAANAGLDDRTDSVEQLWQLCTSLREHRGDGHVVALASHHISGCEAHQLHAAAHGTPHAVLQDNRGFSADEWQATTDQLHARGLMDTGALTSTGRELAQSIESLTDELAEQPIVTSSIDARLLIDQLAPIAHDIVESSILPFPNPMGLPGPER